MDALSYTDEDNTVLHYRLYVPDDYSAEKEYPLVLFLHGAGERGTNNFSQINNVGIINRIINSDTADFDCIIVAPQCATNNQWVDTPWAYGSYVQDNIPISKYMKATKSLISHIESIYSVDSKRLYVTGLSMGGYGSWDIITRYPDMFAAAIPICGAGDPSKAELIKDVAIWAFHGSDDNVVPVEGTRQMVDALEEHDGNIQYTEYPGVDHGSWGLAYAEDNLLTWLFAQEQAEPDPTTASTTEPTTESTSEPTTEPTTTDDDISLTETLAPKDDDSKSPKTGKDSIRYALISIALSLSVSIFGLKAMTKSRNTQV